MKLYTLHSGSKGNCSLLTIGDNNILIDCGIGYRGLTRYLSKLDRTPDQIKAVFVTHSHSDHVSGLKQLLAVLPDIPIYVHNAGVEEFKIKIGYEPVGFEGEVEMFGAKITTYRCYHDVACCVGYKIIYEDKTLCYVTDTGYVDDDLTEFVKSCNCLLIESNHDVAMLLNGDYPFELKRRIKSTVGHLSNSQTALLLERVLKSGIETVILAHLSENNNTPAIAYNSAKAVMRRLKVGTKLKVATQNDICETEI